MEKILNFIVPGIIFVLVVAGIGWYAYLTSIPALDSKIQTQTLEDEAYLAKNQATYADCHYTVKSNGDTSIATITNRLFNSGISEEKLKILESQFLGKYSKQCESVISDYEARYEQYQYHKTELAKSRQSKLDQLTGKEPKVEKTPSDTFSLYEKYDPRSLQYPIYSDAKLLYSSAEYEDFVRTNL